VIVDNRAGGAGGTVGAKSVVTAEPDGHTILLCSTSNLLIAPLIYKDVGYNAGTFVPVARIGDAMEMLAVHPSVPARSVAELVSLAKSRPGRAEFQLGRCRNASTSRGRTAESTDSDRYQPHSLSRRQPAPDWPAGRENSNSVPGLG
jgi:hypothetical protein